MVALAAKAQFPGVALVCFVRAAPCFGGHHDVFHAQGGELAVENIAEASRFIATQDAGPCCDHFPDPCEKRGLIHPLCRLRQRVVDLANHGDLAGMDIEPENDQCAGADAGRLGRFSGRLRRCRGMVRGLGFPAWLVGVSGYLFLWFEGHRASSKHAKCALLDVLHAIYKPASPRDARGEGMLGEGREVGREK